MTFTYIFFPVSIFLYFISISGFGKLLLKTCRLDNLLNNHYRNIEFFFGLFFIGFISLLFNLKYNFSDIYSICIISIGIVTYLFFFIYNPKKIAEIYFIFIVILISFFLSFYSLSNDDFFGYHLKTILNFKDYNSFDITHGRTTSYNSHWLLINSAYFLKSFPFSIFCILSLLYSLTIMDFYKSFKYNYENKNYVASLFSFFCVVFFIGVLNQYKDFGTDVPGQIILFYFLLIFFEKQKVILNKNDKKIFAILVFLSMFSFVIKIYNGLIFIFLFFIFLKLKNKLYLLITSAFISIPTLFWILQNYIISRCLIWPLTFLCFANLKTSKIELQMIEQFAKGDFTLSANMDEINWISMWFANHFHKIIETYALYILILFMPPLIYYIRLNHSNKSIYLKEVKNFFYNFYISNKSFISFILISNIIWFIFIPAYRFGIFFNLSLVVFIIIPFWNEIIKSRKKFYLNSFKIIFSIAIIFFLIENITKYSNYISRHGYIWPNIEISNLK